MKWFKHNSNFYESQLYRDLHDYLGQTGIASYHTLTEICFQKLSKKNGVRLSEDDCYVFLFTSRVLSTLKIKEKTFNVLITILERRGVLKIVSNEDGILEKLSKLERYHIDVRTFNSDYKLILYYPELLKLVGN